VNGDVDCEQRAKSTSKMRNLQQTSGDTFISESNRRKSSKSYLPMFYVLKCVSCRDAHKPSPVNWFEEGAKHSLELSDLQP
jgi:hypothetical protein